MRMRLKKAGRLATLLAAVAMTTTLAAPLPGAGAASSKQMAKQIKALKQQITALNGLASGLQTKIASLEADRQASAPPLERAGGDFVGIYPNPQIRTGTIVGDDIADRTIFGRHFATETISGVNVADGTISSADILDGSIAQADLSSSSIGAPQLIGAFVVSGFSNPVGGNNASGGSEATCPPNTRMLTGGVEWSAGAKGLTVFLSGPSVASPNTSWEVAGMNTSGTTRTITAKALCLAEQP